MEHLQTCIMANHNIMNLKIGYPMFCQEQVFIDSIITLLRENCHKLRDLSLAPPPTMHCDKVQLLYVLGILTNDDIILPIE